MIALLSSNVRYKIGFIINNPLDLTFSAFFSFLSSGILTSPIQEENPFDSYRKLFQEEYSAHLAVFIDYVISYSESSALVSEKIKSFSLSLCFEKKWEKMGETIPANACNGGWLICLSSSSIVISKNETSFSKGFCLSDYFLFRKLIHFLPFRPTHFQLRPSHLNPPPSLSFSSTIISTK